MRMPKLAFKDKPVTEQLALARRVANQMAAEPTLAARVTRLPQLQARLAEAEAAATAVELARKHWRAEVTRRNQLMRELRQTTRYAAQELLSTGAKELEFLQAGLELARRRTPIGAMPMPTGVHAVTGTLEGTVKITWDLIRLRGTVYQLQQRDTPEGEWHHVEIKTRRQCVVSGLESGRLYWFRVAAIGAAGPGPWSQAASARAA